MAELALALLVVQAAWDVGLGGEDGLGGWCGCGETSRNEGDC